MFCVILIPDVREQKEGDAQVNDNMASNRIGVSWKISAYEEIEKMGYDYMDVIGTDLMNMSDGVFDEIASRVRKGSLPCCNICLYCPPSLQMMGDSFSAEAIRDYAKRMCDRCSVLGITGIGIGSGHSRRIPEGYNKNKAEGQLLESIRITAEVAAVYGICVMIEPLNSFVCNHMLSTKEAADFIDRVSMDNVGMVFDFHHFTIMDERLDDLHSFVPYMRSVQFNEVDIVSGEKRFLVDENISIYQKQLGTLIKYGYSGSFSLEALITDDFSTDAARSLRITKQALENIYSSGFLHGTNN